MSGSQCCNISPLGATAPARFICIIIPELGRAVNCGYCSFEASHFILAHSVSTSKNISATSQYGSACIRNDLGM